MGSGGVNPPAISETPNDSIDLSNSMFRLGGKIDSLTLRNIRRGTKAPSRPLVYVTDRFQQTDIGQLTIDGLTIAEPRNDEIAEAQIFVAAPAAGHTTAIGTLRVANVTWQRANGQPANAQQSRGRLIQINGGNIDQVQLQNITGGNIAHIVDINGTRQTRVNTIRASGVRMDNARASDEAFVSAGPVVSRADFTNVTTSGRLVNNRSRFPNAQGNEGGSNSVRNNPDRNNPDRANNGDRTATSLVENFVGKANSSLADTTPEQHGGVGQAAWTGINGNDWRFTGSGAVRARTATAGALYSLANAGSNVTLRATFKTGDTSGAQIVLRSNDALTGYIAVNLDPNGVKMYDLGASGDALPNEGPGVAANMAHSVVITLRGNNITVTVDDEPPITNKLSSRNANNPRFGIRNYGGAGVEFSAFSISSR